MKPVRISPIAFLFFCLVSFSAYAETYEEPVVLHYQLKGVIHGGSFEIVNQIFERAKKQSFLEAILIELDTPGGLLDSTEEIVKLFLNSEIPVIVYVAPRGARAGSAGTFITMAAHIAAMAPGTYIGAAHPVSLFGGGDKENSDAQEMKKKIESATSSFITAIAEQRGRNKEWAVKAVLESESLVAESALEKKVIDLVANDTSELLKTIHGRIVKLPKGEKKISTERVQIVHHTLNWGLKFLNFLASPTVIYLLILGVIAGLYVEISHPGMVLPGVAAGICLLLVLFANRVLPINLMGILLILTALGLLVAEIFVTSFGLLTAAAIACFFFGSLFLFDPVKTEVAVPLSFIIASSLALAGIAIMIGIAIARTFGRGQKAGKEGMVGWVGVIEDDCGPGLSGKILLGDEYWSAESAYPLKKGDKAVVSEVKGLKVVVKSLT